MSHFTEGARWTAYGNGGLRDKYFMTLDVEGKSLTGVMRFSEGFVAMSMLTGSVLSNIVDLDVAVAEAEALHPANS